MKTRLWDAASNHSARVVMDTEFPQSCYHPEWDGHERVYRLGIVRDGLLKLGSHLIRKYGPNAGLFERLELFRIRKREG
ncbi:hypothetical protein BH11PLA2_BH11PLA2_34720 [soil metagenome]